MALGLAERLGGVVINADSMQVYRDLRILSARPSADDEARAPHRLYGMMSADDPCSVGRWLPWARREVARAHEAGQVPIVVGGSGLYLNALTEGIAVMPEVPDAVRAAVRERLRAQGAAALHAELHRCDPDMADRLRPSDPQRIARALEVLEASGRSLLHWQAQAPAGGLEARWLGLVLQLPRELLYRRCDIRLAAMLHEGGLDEVAALLARGLDPALPAMRALGVPHLILHLRGECDRQSALVAAQTATRQYAKRQLTWFRHKMISWNAIEAQDSECFFEKIFPFVSEFLLTPPD